MWPSLLTVALLLAVVLWLVAPSRKARRSPEPEDDVTTPIDEAELAAAERELAEDPRPRALDQGYESEEKEDDWGPGTR